MEINLQDCARINGLFHNIHLGALYNRYNESIVENKTLWNEETFNNVNFVQVVSPRPTSSSSSFSSSSNYIIRETNAIQSRMDVLEMENGLRLGYMLDNFNENNIYVRYLKKQRSLGVERVDVYYKQSTITESMTRWALQEIDNQHILEEFDAFTHFVVAIEYGITFLVSAECKERQNKGTNLHEEVVKVMENDESKNDNNTLLTCSLYTPDYTSTNEVKISQLKEFWCSVKEQVEEGSHKALWLYLLPKERLPFFQQTSTKLYPTLSDITVLKCVKALEHLYAFTERLKNLHQMAIIFPSLAKKLCNVQNIVTEYTTEKYKNFHTMLADFYSEKVLEEALSRKMWSTEKLCHFMLDKWLTEKEEEVKRFQILTAPSNSSFVDEIEECLYSNKSVVMSISFGELDKMYISSLQDTLSTQSSTSKTKLPNHDSWDQDVEFVAKLDEYTKIFVNLTQSNKNDEDVQFFVTTTGSNTRDVSVDYFYQGSLENEFKLPQMLQLSVDTGHKDNSLVIKWELVERNKDRDTDESVSSSSNVLSNAVETKIGARTDNDDLSKNEMNDTANNKEKSGQEKKEDVVEMLKNKKSEDTELSNLQEAKGNQIVHTKEEEMENKNEVQLNDKFQLNKESEKVDSVNIGDFYTKINENQNIILSASGIADENSFLSDNSFERNEIRDERGSKISEDVDAKDLEITENRMKDIKINTFENNSGSESVSSLKYEKKSAEYNHAKYGGVARESKFSEDSKAILEHCSIENQECEATVTKNSKTKKEVIDAEQKRENEFVCYKKKKGEDKNQDDPVEGVDNESVKKSVNASENQNTILPNSENKDKNGFTGNNENNYDKDSETIDKVSIKNEILKEDGGEYKAKVIKWNAADKSETRPTEHNQEGNRRYDSKIVPNFKNSLVEHLQTDTKIKEEDKKNIEAINVKNKQTGKKKKDSSSEDKHIDDLINEGEVKITNQDVRNKVHSKNLANQDMLNEKFLKYKVTVRSLKSDSVVVERVFSHEEEKTCIVNKVVDGEIYEVIVESILGKFGLKGCVIEKGICTQKSDMLVESDSLMEEQDTGKTKIPVKLESGTRERFERTEYRIGASSASKDKPQQTTMPPIEKGDDVPLKECLLINGFLSNSRLGSLYDRRKDTIVYGLALWEEESLKNEGFVAVRKTPSQDWKFELENSVSNKMNNLNIEGGLKLSVMSGLLDLQGSGKYINEGTTYEDVAAVSLIYKQTTVTKELTPKAFENLDYAKILSDDNFTHIVVAIQYGGNCAMLLEKKLNSGEKVDNIGGDLKAYIKGGIIGADASVDHENKVQKYKQEVTCTVRSDIDIDGVVDDLESAKELYHSLPQKMKNVEGVPVWVWLLPKDRIPHENVKKATVREISDELVTKTIDAVESFAKIISKTQQLYSLAKDFPVVQNKVKSFQNCVQRYKTQFQEKVLKKLIVSIRSKEEDETRLGTMLADLNKSSFGQKSLEDWYEMARTEFNLLQMYKSCITIDNIEIVSKAECEKICITNTVCVTLTIQVCKEDDQLILKMTNELDERKENNRNTMSATLLWFLDSDFLQKMRRNIIAFRDFSMANKDNNSVKFIAQILPAYETMDIYVNVVDTGNRSDKFIPPTKPKNVVISDKTHTSLTLHWESPLEGRASVTNYQISYTESKAKKGEFRVYRELEVFEKEIIITNLKPATEYLLKIRTKCCKLDLYGPVEEVKGNTYPYGAPANIAFELTHKRIATLSWANPLGVENCSCMYQIELSQNSQNNIISTRRTSENKFCYEKLLFDKTYIFRVKMYACDEEVSCWSHEFEFATEPCPPPLISELKIQNQTVQLMIKEEEVYKNQVTRYSMRVKGEDFPMESEDDQFKFCVAISTLEAGWHKICVKAITDYGQSGWSKDRRVKKETEQEGDDNTDGFHLIKSTKQSLQEDIQWALKRLNVITEEKIFSTYPKEKRKALLRIIQSLMKGDCRPLNETLKWRENRCMQMARHNATELKFSIITALNICVRQTFIKQLLLAEMAVPVFFHSSGLKCADLSLGHTQLNEWELLNSVIRLTQERRPLVSAVRLGVLKASKTLICNDILGIDSSTKKGFFKKTDGSDEYYEQHGFVEGVWYRTTESYDDQFKHSFGVLNLRGDAITHSAAFFVLAKTSEITIIFLSDDVLLNKGYENLLEDLSEELIESKSKINAIIVTDKKTTIGEAKNAITKYKGVFLKVSFLSAEGKTYVQELRNTINEMLHEVGGIGKSLTERFDESLLESKDYTWSDVALTKATHTVEMLLKPNEKDAAAFNIETTFPLQSFFKQSSKLVRLRHRSTKFSYEEAKTRRNGSLLAVGTGMELCLNFLQEKRDIDEVILYLREIDYHLTTESLHNKEIQSLLTINNILQEVARHHEVLFDVKFSEATQEGSTLPETAAAMMIKGVPIELIDSATKSIHTNWIRDTLSCVTEKLKKKLSIRHDPNVFIVSRISCQRKISDGLFHKLFGAALEIPLRKYEGSVMRLLPINISGFPCDAILLIDAEPIAHHADEIHDEYHNELMAFFVLLSDICIIHHPKNGLDILKDNLEVATLTMLKLNLACTETKLMFVTEKDASCEKKKEMQNMVSQLESCWKRFPYIIHNRSLLHSMFSFDPDEDIFTISTQLGRVVCSEVHDQCARLRDNLLRNVKNRQSKNTFSSLGHNITNIWNGVMKENVTIQFRNHDEISVYYEIESDMQAWKSSLANNVNVLLNDAFKIKLGVDKINMNAIKSQNQQMHNKIKEKAGKYFQLYRARLSRLLAAKNIYNKLNASFRNKILQCFEEFCNTLLADYLTPLEVQFNLYKNEMAWRESVNESLTFELQKMADAFVKENNSDSLERKEIDRKFEAIWQQKTECFKPCHCGDAQLHNVSVGFCNYLREKFLYNQYYFEISERFGENLTNPFKKEWIDYTLVKYNQRESYILEKVVKILLPKSRFNLAVKNCVLRNKVNFLINETIKYLINEKLQAQEDDECSMKMQKMDIPFSCPHLCRHFIDEALVSFRNHYKELKYESEFELTGALEMIFCFHAASVAAKYFEKAKSGFLHATSMKMLAEEEKIFFKNVFEEQITYERLKVSVKLKIVSDTFEAAYDNAIKDLCSSTGTHSLAGEVLMRYIPNKETVHGLVLLDVLDAIQDLNHTDGDEFQMVFDYFNEPRKAFMKKITAIVKTNVGSMEKEVKDRFYRNIRESILAMSKWSTNDNELHEGHGLDFMKDIARLKVHDRTQCIEELGSCIKDQLNTVLESKMEKENMEDCEKKLLETIYRFLFKCNQLCPFCKLPCDSDHTYDDQRHFSRAHRPQGFGHVYVLKTHEFSLDICSNLVASEKYYRGGKSDKKIKYKNYHKLGEPYSSWNITESNMNSILWKHITHKVMCRIGNFFFDVKPADTSSWGCITTKEAQDEVKKLYYVTNAQKRNGTYMP